MHFQYWVRDNMATILRKIFWNMISMKTYVIWLKLHWNLFTRIQWTICLHFSSSPRWVLNVFCILIFLWLQIRFPLNVIARKFTISCMPSHLSYWYHEYVYTNTIYLYWSTCYVKGSLYTWQYPLVLYHCVSRISIFFSIDEIKIFIIIIIYVLIVVGWCIHASEI